MGSKMKAVFREKLVKEFSQYGLTGEAIQKLRTLIVHKKLNKEQALEEFNKSLLSRIDEVKRLELNITGTKQMVEWLSKCTEDQLKDITKPIK